MLELHKQCVDRHYSCEVRLHFPLYEEHKQRTLVHNSDSVWFVDGRLNHGVHTHRELPMERLPPEFNLVDVIAILIPSDEHSRLISFPKMGSSSVFQKGEIVRDGAKQMASD